MEPKKQDKQTRQKPKPRLIVTQNRLVVARGEGGRGVVKWVKGIKKYKFLGDFAGGTVVKNPPANAGDTGSSPGLGRFHMLRSN